MPAAEAERVLRGVSPNTAMRTLAGYARLLAAVVRIYPERMDTPCGDTTIRASFLNATKPAHFQWLMNAVRYRSRLNAKQQRALASGTTRNEQLHHRLNSHFRQVLHTSQRLLKGAVKT